jgi:hypothetical protein
VHNFSISSSPLGLHAVYLPLKGRSSIHGYGHYFLPQYPIFQPDRHHRSLHNVLLSAGLGADCLYTKFPLKRVPYLSHTISTSHPIILLGAFLVHGFPAKRYARYGSSPCSYTHQENNLPNTFFSIPCHAPFRPLSLHKSNRYFIHL